MKNENVCSVKNCGNDCEVVLSSIDDGKEKIILCANDLLFYSLGMIKDENLIKYLSDTNITQICEICGEEAVLYKEYEAEMKLCNNHLHRLIKRNLSPEDFKILYNRYGNIFLLHDDFYDAETGESFQPVEE